MTALGAVAQYSNEKVPTDTLTIYNYISTENMIPNKEGITSAISLPPSDKVNKFTVGDILISNIRPYFKKIWFADMNGGASSDILNIKVNDGVNKRYVYYCLLDDSFFDYVMVGAKGVKMPRGDKEQILRYEIPIPSVEDQEYIVSKILPFEEKLQSNLRLIKYLEEYSQLLFRKWFIDFNFPNEAGKEYRNNNGEMYEKDGVLIPSGWDRIPLSELADKSTQSVSPQQKPDKIFKHFSIPIYDEKRTYASELGSTILSNKYLVSKGSILVSKLNPWFKRIVYYIEEDEAICSTEFVVWRPLKENLLEYFFTVANSDAFINYCTNASSGTSNSHKRVNPDYMMDFKLSYNENIVVKFNNIISPIVEKINLILTENQNIKEARDLFIKKLIKY